MNGFQHDPFLADIHKYVGKVQNSNRVDKPQL